MRDFAAFSSHGSGILTNQSLPPREEKGCYKMKKANISLSDADIKLLEELKEFFDARTYSDVLRRSLVQTSHLTKYVDSDGNIKVKTPDGETLLVPKRW